MPHRFYYLQQEHPSLDFYIEHKQQEELFLTLKLYMRNTSGDSLNRIISTNLPMVSTMATIGRMLILISGNVFVDESFCGCVKYSTS